MSSLSSFGKIVILLSIIGLMVGLSFALAGSGNRGQTKLSTSTGTVGTAVASGPSTYATSVELAAILLVSLLGIYVGYLGTFWDRLDQKLNVTLKVASSSVAVSIAKSAALPALTLEEDPRIKQMIMDHRPMVEVMQMRRMIAMERLRSKPSKTMRVRSTQSEN